ncbi:MAG: GTPase, partial [Candidatus Aenigmarchaeota archaeon]|nr:GTPase [Candidatus Aenigmarchaeota archaeon]
PQENVEFVRNNVKKYNPTARIIHASSEITVSDPKKIKNKRVVVVEDGPTLTHGGMKFGAGTIAAQRYNCKIIDPRPYAVGSIKQIFKKYKHLGNVLPAMGYNKKQKEELQRTINRCKCDVVVVGTPIDLRKILKINKPAVRIRYDLEQIGRYKLEKFIDIVLGKRR